MAEPIFMIQIVEVATGRVVERLYAGGALERDLIRDCTAAAVKRGVGIFRTEAQVSDAIEAGFREVLSGLKKATRSLV